MFNIKKTKVGEPKLITDEKEVWYCNEILPLKAEISKLDCENYKLQQENKQLNKKWHKLKRKIKNEIGKTYDLTTEDYREERKYILTTYKYVLYIMKELEKAKENK